MKLTIGPNTEAVDPTEQQVLDALAGLTEDTDSFAILSETGQYYIQTRKTEYGYAIEYREGGHDSHYKSRTTVTLATLTGAFLHYLSKSPHGVRALRSTGRQRLPRRAYLCSAPTSIVLPHSAEERY